MNRLFVVGKRIKDGLKAWVFKYHFIVPLSVIKDAGKYSWKVLMDRNTTSSVMDRKAYDLWIKKNERQEETPGLVYQPLISVLIPVYNVRGDYLRECIDSVLGQSYKKFEICIVDDASTDDGTLGVLEEYSNNKVIRIKHRKKNGHISIATNDALEMAKGEFVALVDNDDVLAENALFEVAAVLGKNKKLDIVYSDEDKLDYKGRRCNPHFKPDYSPDTLLSMNYFCHLTVVRTSLLRKIGGFQTGLEGAQDYDMVLRATEKTKEIYHIPKILYHWRMADGSTALDNSNKNYALERNKTALQNAIKRRRINAGIFMDEVAQHYGVIYKLEKEPLVSIIIPVRDCADITKTCLSSVFEKTEYDNYEVIVMNNRSKEKETFKVFEDFKKRYKNFRVIDADMNFNYSKINNIAVSRAKGSILVFLNNDIEVITSDWLNIMVGYAVRPHVGAVGAKLLYYDDTVQHVGVVVGVGGVAGHAHVGIKDDEPGFFGRARMPYDWGAVTAACLCIEKNKFNEVGGFEEDLEVAFNDIDLDLKLLEAGYYNVVVPMVKLYHYESKTRGDDSTPQKQKRFNGEVEYMKKKWKKYIDRDPFYNVNLSLKKDFTLDKQKDNKVK